MRILIATHAPLSRKYGAAHIALNLADALRRRGVEVEVWSPQPIPRTVRFWHHHEYMHRALLFFLAKNRPFDVLDAPAFLIPSGLGREMRVVARSVQPDLRYIWCEANAGAWYRKIAPRAVINGALSLVFAGRILAGWRRADVILCLGRGELDWMRRHFPWWRRKLKFYVSAPDVRDRNRFLDLRQKRRTSVERKYLWIGRWASHKGTVALVEFLESIAQSEPGSVTTIAGCGHEASRDVPRHLLESARVRIVNEFDREQLMELLRDNNIGLFTSVVEGWGLSLQEMLEAGLIVHATRAGAATDLAPYFENQLFAFPPGISQYRGPGDLTQRYLEEFSWDRIAADYLSIASQDMGAAHN